MELTTLKTEETPVETPAEIPGVGIRIQGELVAWFADPELAHQWATDNFFGQWFAHACTMPNRPPFSKEQLEKARQEADELAKHFGIGQMADEADADDQSA